MRRTPRPGQPRTLRQRSRPPEARRRGALAPAPQRLMTGATRASQSWRLGSPLYPTPRCMPSGPMPRRIEWKACEGRRPRAGPSALPRGHAPGAPPAQGEARRRGCARARWRPSAGPWSAAERRRLVLPQKSSRRHVPRQRLAQTRASRPPPCPTPRCKTTERRQAASNASTGMSSRRRCDATAAVPSPAPLHAVPARRRGTRSSHPRRPASPPCPTPRCTPSRPTPWRIEWEACKGRRPRTGPSALPRDHRPGALPAQREARRWGCPPARWRPSTGPWSAAAKRSLALPRKSCRRQVPRQRSTPMRASGPPPCPTPRCKPTERRQAASNASACQSSVPAPRRPAWQRRPRRCR